LEVEPGIRVSTTREIQPDERSGAERDPARSVRPPPLQDAPPCQAWPFLDSILKASLSSFRSFIPANGKSPGNSRRTQFLCLRCWRNLTNHADALGTLVNYTYTTNGLVLTSTDANGHTTSFAYDGNGFLIAKTDPAANTTTYTISDVGGNSGV